MSEAVSSYEIPAAIKQKEIQKQSVIDLDDISQASEPLDEHHDFDLSQQSTSALNLSQNSLVSNTSFDGNYDRTRLYSQTSMSQESSVQTQLNRLRKKKKRRMNSLMIDSDDNVADVEDEIMEPDDSDTSTQDPNALLSQIGQAATALSEVIKKVKSAKSSRAGRRRRKKRNMRTKLSDIQPVWCLCPCIDHLKSYSFGFANNACQNEQVKRECLIALYPVLKNDPSNQELIERLIFRFGMHPDDLHLLKRSKKKCVKWIEKNVTLYELQNVMAKYHDQEKPKRNDLETATENILHSNLITQWTDHLNEMNVADVQAHFCTDHVV